MKAPFTALILSLYTFGLSGCIFLSDKETIDRHAEDTQREMQDVTIDCRLSGFDPNSFQYRDCVNSKQKQTLMQSVIEELLGFGVD